MRRWIAAILAIFDALNGLAMLFAGPAWYAARPGASNRPSMPTSSRTSARHSWWRASRSQRGHGGRCTGGRCGRLRVPGRPRTDPW